MAQYLLKYLLIDLNNPQYRKFDDIQQLVDNLLGKNSASLIVINVDPVTGAHTVIDIPSTRFVDLYNQFNLPIPGNRNVPVDCE